MVNMHILILPPSATTSIQPMDQGIIYSWKRITVKAKARWQISRHEQAQNASLKNATISHALRWAKKAWDQVDGNLITRAWKRSRIHPKDQPGDEGTEGNKQIEVGQDDDNVVLQTAQDIDGQTGHERLSAHQIATALNEEDEDALIHAPPTQRSTEELIEEAFGNEGANNQQAQESEQEETDRASHTLTYKEAMRTANYLWNFAVSKSNDFSERFSENLPKVLDELDEAYSDPSRLKQKTK
jgi:hypothetical protein